MSVGVFLSSKASPEDGFSSTTTAYAYTYPSPAPSSSPPAMNYHHPLGPSLAPAVPAELVVRHRLGQLAPHDLPGLARVIDEVFHHLLAGRLGPAMDDLVHIGNWLCSHLTDLGLSGQLVGTEQSRRAFWAVYNHGWLAAVQRQKDARAGAAPGTAPVPDDRLRRIGDDLIRIGDFLEQHALVDYEVGVLEDHILDELGRCMSG